MKALILAAGIPRRMGLGSIPQCLLEVQGKKIIDYQLEALQACGITDIIVVVGYEQEQIKKYLGSRVFYIENPEYAATNSAYSLWLAREHGQDGFIYLNSDLVIEKEILQKVLSSPYPSAFGFDRKYDFTSDMHKIILLGDRVIHHGHNISNDIAHGEAVGPVKVSAVFAKAVFQKIEQELAQGNTKQSVYGLFNDVAKYCPMYGVNITGLKWSEVDTPEDLQLATTIFGSRVPFIVLMYGNPATGKTVTSKAIQEYCSQFTRTALISTASLREEIGLVDLYSAQEREEIYQLMVERMATAMRWKRVNIVLDGNFLKFPIRKKIYERAVENSYQIFVVHCLVSTEDIIPSRLAKRNSHSQKIEEAAASMDLYQMTKNSADPLDIDRQTDIPLSIVEVDTAVNTVEKVYLSDTAVSDTLTLLQNGIKYAFTKAEK